jgi:hypothetical protein
MDLSDNCAWQYSCCSGSRRDFYDDVRCDEGVVNIGATDADVREKCGEPNSQSMDKWIYNFGPSESFTVIFKEGKVVRILEGQ